MISLLLTYSLLKMQFIILLHSYFLV